MSHKRAVRHFILIQSCLFNPGPCWFLYPLSKTRLRMKPGVFIWLRLSLFEIWRLAERAGTPLPSTAKSLWHCECSCDKGLANPPPPFSRSLLVLLMQFLCLWSDEQAGVRRACLINCFSEVNKFLYPSASCTTHIITTDTREWIEMSSAHQNITLSLTLSLSSSSFFLHMKQNFTVIISRLYFKIDII